MKIITPVYDRTPSDVVDKTQKGYFNISDWERVANNSKIVNDLVVFLTQTAIEFDAITPPTISTIPSVDDLNILLANIERMRVSAGFPAIDGMVEIKDDWTAGSAADAPDYESANDWERVLDLILNTIGAMTEYTIYCGVGSAGQPRFYQHRFRQFNWVVPATSPVRRARANVAGSGSGITRNNGFRRYA